VLIACLSALALALVAGCSTSNTVDGGQNSGDGMMGDNGSDAGPVGDGVMGDNGSDAGPVGDGVMGDSSGTDSSSSVGERIFLTGVGSDGQAIERNAPGVSEGSGMMGGNGCGSCHGDNGRGGTIRMMMGTDIETPDITYDELIEDGFTDATIKRAIREGLDEAGKPLEDAMPRWQMSDADVDATIAYLKQLSAQ
jgi:hypothetical protein